MMASNVYRERIIFLPIDHLAKNPVKNGARRTGMKGGLAL
jgi:hypothetical protein